MNWLFVSRREYDRAMSTSVGWCGHYQAACEQLSVAYARIADLERALDIANALKREEQWRRIKAEGLCQYKDDRIRRVLGLPIWADEEKKTA